MNQPTRNLIFIAAGMITLTYVAFVYGNWHGLRQWRAVNLVLNGPWYMNGEGADFTAANQAAIIQRDDMLTMNGVMNKAGRVMLIAPDGTITEVARFKIPHLQSTVIVQASTFDEKPVTTVVR